MNNLIQNKKISLYLFVILLAVMFSNKSFADVGPIKQVSRFKVENVTIVEAIMTLINNTKYNIIFAEEDIDLVGHISVDLKDTTIDKILFEILKDSDLTFTINDKSIVILKDEKPKPIYQKKDEFLINGKIMSKEDKSPIVGATVIILNTTKGAISDDGGNFAITASQNDTLEVSYIGYKTQIKVLTEKVSDLLFEMESDAIAIEQIFVNGYVKTAKARVTGSVGVVSADELKGAPLNGLDMLMQGKIAGVNIQAVSGRPGETAKIRIRGTNTITGNAEPLWVVDGVMLQNDIPNISSGQIKTGDFNTLFTNGISGINPNDIESITVLKDASAAAIYGSRAAGGVIVVTTKRGKSGKINISYSTNVSVTTKPIRDVDLMNSKEKINFEKELWDEFSAKGFAENQYYPVVGIVGMVRSGQGKYKGMSTLEQEDHIESLANGPTTDWFDEIFNTSVSHSHYLSLSGGSDKVAYYISGGYNNNKGLVKNNVYDRYNLSSKLDVKITNNLKVDFNTSISYQRSIDSSLGVNLFDYAYFANPYESPYNPDGSYRADETYFTLRSSNGDDTQIVPDNGINIMRDLNETSSEAKNLSLTQTVSLSWRIVDNLKFEGLGSLSYTNNNTDNINGKDSYVAFLNRPFDDTTLSQRKYGSITQSGATNTSYNFRGQFSYSKEFGKHYFSSLIGSEIRSAYAKNIFSKRYGYDPVTGNSSIPLFPSNESGNISYEELVRYASIVDGMSGQTIDESAVASFYFATDYTYNDKYTASFTARTDGSNNFGSEEQFNPIWSLGATWNILNEKFMEDTKDIFSNLTFRAATGFTGNINKSIYPQFVMKYATNFRKTENDYYRMSSAGSPPNPNLRWEKTFDYKVGIDVGLLKNRLSFQAEYYNRETTDAVTNVSVPKTTGFGSQSYNTSTILNQGVEFTLSGTPIKGQNFSLNMSANLSYNNNVLKDYNSVTGTDNGGMLVNYPLNSVFSGVPEGVDPYTGIYMFKARKDAIFNNKQDYEDADNYYFYVGTSSAPIAGGYSISANYKRFSFSVGGTYSVGAIINDDINSPGGYNSINTTINNNPPTKNNDLYINHYNVDKNSTNRWTPTNQITDGYPRLIDAFAPKDNYESYMTRSNKINKGALIQDVSYFKINSIVMAYSFSENLINKIGISSLSMNFSINNILTITNYKGFDPETPGAVYPQSRSMSLGLSVGF